METNLSPHGALMRALELAGSQAKLGKIGGVSATAVQKWISAGRVRAESVLAIEAATGVSRHDLRPDIYPRPQPKTAAEAGDDGEALSPWDTGEYANYDPNLDLFPGAVH
ncbi:transcriptional regulator [Asticcacaulis solisilvae]|uniref:transcriptional regulator n=1 Tax=Asticcacaulis solisilvae TaxID=1217274 RepID=UPI003FD7C3B1